MPKDEKKDEKKDENKEELRKKLQQKLYAKRIGRSNKNVRMEVVDKVCNELNIDKELVMKEVEKLKGQKK